jgi:hypothetical protein
MKTRQIEYYRLWGSDSGSWDTAFIDIPADTPDDKIEEAVQEAVREQFTCTNEHTYVNQPVIVGVYSIPPIEENCDET